MLIVMALLEMVWAAKRTPDDAAPSAPIHPVARWLNEGGADQLAMVSAGVRYSMEYGSRSDVAAFAQGALDIEEREEGR